MKHFDRIFAFITVVQRNGFAAAARSVGVSTAAISKQITSLEEALGVQLLLRTTRRLSLTEAGKVYYDYCVRILEELREADASVSQFRKEPIGRLHILAGPQFAERFLLPHIGKFLEANPRVTLDIELEQRAPDVIGENFDIVMGLTTSGPPNCVQRKLSVTRNVFLASPQYIENFGTPKKPEDLMNHKFISHGMRVQENILRFEDRKEIHLAPIMRLNDIRAMLTVAEKGVGIIRVHDYTAKKLLDEGKLVRILQGYATEQEPLFLYYPQQKILPARIHQFIDFVVHTVEQESRIGGSVV